MPWPPLEELSAPRCARQGEIEIEKTKFMEALEKEKKIYMDDIASWGKRIEVVRAFCSHVVSARQCWIAIF